MEWHFKSDPYLKIKEEWIPGISRECYSNCRDQINDVYISEIERLKTDNFTKQLDAFKDKYF